jgi:hypothetical protein
LALLLFVGFSAAMLDLWRRVPKDVHVRFRWGQARRGLQSADIRYQRDGQDIRRVTFRYGREAPDESVHLARLPRGDCVVRVRLSYASGARDARAALHVGTDDEVVLPGPW